MTREEARLTLQENFGYLSEEHPRIVEALKVALNVLGEPSIPSNLDEAAEETAKKYYCSCLEKHNETGICDGCENVKLSFKAGAEWMAGQGWIDDGSMPPETKQESDTIQGHREWTESKPVLAWDSMYGCRVDWTRNGKWMSETRGGYTGQICHGIIAWRPIPEYKEKQ